MTTRLGLYNEALRLCGERNLASLSESREPRRLLDAVWDDSGIRSCLEQGLWNFATRTVKLEYSPSVESDFGYQRAFDKPEDFVRTVGLCSDEYFRNPLLEYVDERGFWWANLDIIYVRYVSDDEEYGTDLSLWPETFTRYVASYFAVEINPRLTNSRTDQDGLEKKMRQRLTDARSKDAMNDPTVFPPSGSWVNARHGHRGRRQDRRGGGGLF